MKKTSLDASTTMRDLEDLGAQIVSAVSKAMEDLATKEDLKSLATKEDLKSLATKEDLKKLEEKVHLMGGDVSDIRRRVIDLETDTPTRNEFTSLKQVVATLVPRT